MDICQVVFGKSHSDLTPEEFTRFRQLTRKANYYRHYQQNVKALRDSKRDRKTKILDALGWKAECERCGYDRCLAALDFHHIDPAKKDDEVLNLPWDEALVEAAHKCQLVCSNCHREIHMNDEIHKRSRGRPRPAADPLLETYMRASGCTEDQIAHALAGR